MSHPVPVDPPHLDSRRISRDTAFPLLRQAVVAMALLLSATPAAAQDLPVKRQVPGEQAAECSVEIPPAAATEEEREQAASLGSSAAQAVILGDRDRARDLLGRAVQLDPRSPDLAYQYGRILEELGEVEAARERYCIVLAVAPEGPDAGDVRERLARLASAERQGISDEAVAAFREGLDRADEERWQPALDAFADAVALAPGWADAVYNRAMALQRLGRDRQAVADLRRYLEMEPDAPDAIQVSERIGQLLDESSLPSPGTALTLGMLVPGMGQFYEGRSGLGLATLAVAGGAAAAALLVEEVEVLCLTVPPAGQECPPGQVLDERTNRPYMVPGLAVAGGVMIVAAVEAFLHARGQGQTPQTPEDAVSLGRVGPVHLAAPGLSRDGSQLRLHLLRLRF